MIKRDAERNIMRATLSQTLKEYWKQYVINHNIGNSRNREYVIPRHAFSVVCEKYANLPLKVIGSITERDHATVIHAKKNHEANYRFDKMYRSIYNNMESDIITIINDSGMEIEGVELYESVSEELISLRLQRMETIKRMRGMRLKHLSEINEYEDKLKHYDFIKKQNKELYERNKYLQNEVNRLKNLL